MNSLNPKSLRWFELIAEHGNEFKEIFRLELRDPEHLRMLCVVVAVFETPTCREASQR